MNSQVDDARLTWLSTRLVDSQALLGHESSATTQIYTNIRQKRMERVVGRS